MHGRPLKVTILGVNYAPERSGIAPYTTGVARGLAALGHDVRVLTSRPHYPEWTVAAEQQTGPSDSVVDGVHVRRLRHYIPARPNGVRRARFEISFGARLATSRWHDPDVVLCISPALLSSGMAIARARVGRARPAIGLVIQDLYSRGVTETGMGGGALARVATRLEASIAGACDGVAVIHDRFKDRVVQGLGVEPERVSVIRNWTHVSPAPDFDVVGFRSSMGWSADETVVLHAGAMGAKQALENVVHAAKLADSGRKPVRFVLLGDGSRREDLERQAAGVSSIEFRASLDDIAFGRALRSADVLLVNEKPGVTEMAVPSKLTSYFSSGRPVLAATDASSTTSDELAAAEAGVRVDPGDPQALLDGALALGSDAQAGFVFGENGRRYCDEVLSEQSAINKYDTWVRQLAARGHTEELADV